MGILYYFNDDLALRWAGDIASAVLIYSASEYQPQRADPLPSHAAQILDNG